MHSEKIITNKSGNPVLKENVEIDEMYQSAGSKGIKKKDSP